MEQGEKSQLRARSHWWRTFIASNRALGLQAFLIVLFLTIIAWGFFSAVNYYFVLGRLTELALVGAQVVFIIVLNIVFMAVLSKAFRDIHSGESELHLEKEQSEALLASIGDGVFGVTLDRKIGVFNRAAEQITGFNSVNVTGKPYHEVLKFVGDDGNALGYDVIEEVFKTGKTAMLPKKASILSRDGKKIPVSDSAAPVRDAQGSVTGVVVAFRDVTKEHELENIKMEFLSLASHQLRTPLSGIKWLIETLDAEKIGPLTKEQKEYVHFILQNNDRMIKLVNDLLSVIRLEGETPSVNASTFTLKELLDEIYEGLHFVAERGGIVFTLEVPGEIQITSDRVLLKTIIDVFVSNAIVYSKKGGRIVLVAKLDGEFVQFSVSDDGIGIPKEERKNIFSKFYRASNAKVVRPEGTGLGLYVSKFLADIIGGVIQVESEEGKGSIFRLTVPFRVNK